MALLAFTGLEGGTVGLYCANTTGNVSVQSTTKKTGTYALDCNPATNAATAYAEFSGLADGGANDKFGGSGVTSLFSSFDVRFDALPGSGDEEWFRAIRSGGGTGGIRLRLNSSGNLVAYQQNGTSLIGTGSTVLSAGTWYRINVKSNTSTTASYEVKIDGVTEFSGTFSGSNDTIASVYLGKSTNNSSQKLRCYFDNMSWSNTAYFSNLAVVKAMFPDSNGSTMQWTSGPSPQDYTQVDDLPSDAGATYVQSAASANQTALFGLQSAASAGIGGTILGVSLQNSIRENAAGASTSAVQIRTHSSNYGTPSNEITLGTTYVPHGWNWNVNPNTSADWTVVELDALECGHAQSAAVAMRLDYTFIEVLFIPSQDETSLAGPGTGRGRASALTIHGVKETPIGTGRGRTSALCSRGKKCDLLTGGRGRLSMATGTNAHFSNARATGRGSLVSATASAHYGNGIASGRGQSIAVGAHAVSLNAGPATERGTGTAVRRLAADGLLPGRGRASALCRKNISAAGLATGRGTSVSHIVVGDITDNVCSGRGSLSASGLTDHLSRAVSRDRSQLFAASNAIGFAAQFSFDRSGRLSARCIRGVIAAPRANGEGRGVAMIPILTRVALCLLPGAGRGTATDVKHASSNGRAPLRGGTSSRSLHGAISHDLGTGRGRLSSQQSKQGVASGPMSAAGRLSAVCRHRLRASGRSSGHGSLSCDRVRGHIARMDLRDRGVLYGESMARTDYLAAVCRLMELDLTATLLHESVITETAQPFQPTVTARPEL